MLRGRPCPRGSSSSRGRSVSSAVAAPGANPTDQILVKFKSNASQAAIDALNASNAVQQVDAIPALGLKVLKVPPGKSAETVVAAYKRNANVQFAEVNALVKPEMIPNDPNYGTRLAPDARCRRRWPGISRRLRASSSPSATPASRRCPTLRPSSAATSAGTPLTAAQIGRQSPGTAPSLPARPPLRRTILPALPVWPGAPRSCRCASAMLTDGVCLRQRRGQMHQLCGGQRREGHQPLLPHGRLRLHRHSRQVRQGKGAVVTVAAGNDGTNPGWPSYSGFLAVAATEQRRPEGELVELR